jgi:hypothetical protein
MEHGSSPGFVKLVSAGFRAASVRNGVAILRTVSHASSLIPLHGGFFMQRLE